MPASREIDLRHEREDASWPSVQVVVDHPAMRRVIHDILGQALGLRVFAPGPVAGDHPDILVTDGRSFFDRTPWRPACPVIVFGPDSDRGYREAALRAGAASWLRGDQLVDELAREIRWVLSMSAGVWHP